MHNASAATIDDVLAELRASALDERDKGDSFERLVKAVLLTDPEWSSRFSHVWLWSEWPGRAGRPDTGIDLVARLREPLEAGELAAIQCKFYDAGRTIAKRDIDSFLSSSTKLGFGARYVFDTAAAWSKNAEEALLEQQVPVQRIDVLELGDAAIDWSQFVLAEPDNVVAAGPKLLRRHQQRALEEVRAGLSQFDRGKLIMACGTGKTFTSLRIAEDLAGVGKQVLFMVPSIQLLSQSLREWMANAEVGIRPYAVCSDVRVGRRNAAADDDDLSVVDLSEPATTDPAKLAERLAAAPADRMTVVFATYQSIDVVARAQTLGAGAFDLVVCDEAHRTTGVTLSGNDESAFVRIHDPGYLGAAKRLYMTATPRVFGDAVRQRADETNAVLADMDDESMYGPELHRLGFGEAVDANLLSDYKVLVLAVDEEYVAKNFQQAMAEAGEIKLDDAARLIGCWNGLAKRFGDDAAEEDRTPMRTAVAFARNIKMSKLASESFPVLVDRARQYDGGVGRLRVEARHVDGTMGIHTRNEHLRWLSSRDAGEGVCRILTNAKCLSEGVDVPALDAVLFLTPRGSQVDVVQSVGRVMRRAPGKTHGYIILPVVVPSGVAPEEALRDNERYRVVWQVLQALRSHDDRFHAMVNSIELNKTRPDTLIIDPVPPPDFEGGDGDLATGEQLGLDLSFEGFRDAMYARIVQKVGERTYWEQWAGDVAQIAQAHIARITALLEDQGSPQAKEFERFLDGLRGNLNESIAAEDAIEMLAQHLITRPIFEALFAGYDFAASNPVAQAMEQMLAELDEHNITAEVATLERFYASVRRRVEGVDNAEGRQRILVELYDKFFAAAFKRTVDRLGIVYTPVEVVDFILRSADAVLRDEFGHGLTEEGVHILDPFTGTGTFVVRLLQSGLIHPADLARKYAYELHANEILLLAYYIAAVNIETTYRDVADEIVPFPGLVFADTFQAYEDGDRLDVDIFPANNERMTRQMGLPLKVIVGNPPYSAGQDSANDDNANESYATLDAAIRSTYAQRSSARRVGSLYDSYVRAIKWATLRLGDRGVIAYVTNGGFLDSNSADGLRKTLADEFSAIYVFNLRGNQRTAGEDSRKEGGKIFGSGSRATVAVTLLVKNPEYAGTAVVRYADVGDYLSREEKLEKIAEAATIMDVATRAITPNEHGDWLDQRREDFERHLPLVAGKEPGIFAMATAGLKTNRDAWNYNASRATLVENTAGTIAFYNKQVEVVAGGGVISRDPQQISWDRVPLRDVERGKTYAFNAESVAKAAYRPFYRLWAYPDRQWNNTVYRIPAFFPRPGLENVGFFVNDPVPANKPAVLMLDAIPDHHVYGKGGTFVARWRYEPVASEGQLDIIAGDGGDVAGGFRRIDNVTDQALQAFQACYPDAGVSKEDVFHYVYAVLHSAEYREIYTSDLKKALPRIPFVSDFAAYVTAGAALAELHLGYETVEPYALDGVPDVPVGDPYEFYSVGAKMRFGRATADQRLAGEGYDRTTIVFNDHITISGIPADAHRYALGPRSAIEWVMDRFYVRTDRSSGIVNDPNESSRERGEPRYILDLIGRIVTVSVETMGIADGLPPLGMIDPKRGST